MEMRNQPERRFDITMNHVEGFLFSTQASEDGLPHGQPFLSDEPDPVGGNNGPATPALLAATVCHCLSASLLETSKKARLQVEGLESRATAVVIPNEEGDPRIRRIEVELEPMLLEESARKSQCEAIFQKYCTVSSSLKPAIDIQVRVNWKVLSIADQKESE